MHIIRHIIRSLLLAATWDPDPAPPSRLSISVKLNSKKRIDIFLGIETKLRSEFKGGGGGGSLRFFQKNRFFFVYKK